MNPGSSLLSTGVRTLAFGCLVLAPLLNAQNESSAPPAGTAEKASDAAAAKTRATENSVVKVFTTSRYPDLFKPWTKQAPREATGSGVVIEGKRILTNAHLALYASQVQVQANQSGDKLMATVEAVSQGIDLAILKLEDESFFDTHPPLPRVTELPQIKDTIHVQGFPVGGTSLSTTKGIVSRIDFASYGMSTTGLRIQIDAAINPGNSGGPALSGDNMIGLAFSRLGGGDNIGYIIPNEEIEIFLADTKDGKIDGKPGTFDSLQTFHNPALRDYLKAGKAAEGIVVNHVDSNEANYPLKPWDLITHIGDTPIDYEGMIRLGSNLRVGFRYLIQKMARDGKVPLTVVRGGAGMKIDLPVYNSRALVLKTLTGTYPSYFIYGPMVFSVGTQEFASGFTSAPLVAALSALGNPMIVRRGDRPAFPDEQIVIVSSPLFPHKLSQGYSNPVGRAVKSVNGVAIKNLVHLVETLRDSKETFMEFEFVGREQERLLFKRAEMVAATEDILSDNGIRAQGSPDTLKAWQAAATN